MKPWICPRCDTVWAPWVPRCTCSPSAATAATRTAPDPDLEEYIRTRVENRYGAKGMDGRTLCTHKEGQPPF